MEAMTFAYDRKIQMHSLSLTKRSKAGAALLSLFGFVLLTGCNNSGGDTSTQGTSQSPETIKQQIAKIQNDPSIPAPAKQQALAGLQRALAEQQQQTQANAAAAEARKKNEGGK
jgi:hypothetical protein